MQARKQGTTYLITGTLADQNGPRDLTGSTCTISMRDTRAGVLNIANQPLTIVTPTAGTFSYTVQPADLATAGNYEIEIKEVRSDGTIWKYPSSGNEPLTVEPAFI